MAHDGTSDKTPLRVTVVTRESHPTSESLQARLEKLRHAGACITFLTREDSINRGGIDRLRRDTGLGRIDLLVAEDGSSITRSLSMFLGVVDEVVKRGVRVVIEDIGLDTRNKHWRTKLILI